MPSDESMEIALRALAGAMEKYHSAVVTTAEEVRGYLSSHQPTNESRDEAVAVGLGKFATGRIDIDRFSVFLGDSSAADPALIEKVEGAYKILSEIASGGESIFRVDVRPGGRLGDAVAGRLSDVGRVFAAGRLAGMATTGSLNAGNNDRQLGPLEFEGWNTAERQIAPPLAVEIDGADLRAGELAEFLDGNLKIVLVVRGAASPAPLVRLISPSVFVVQTADETGLDRFAQYEGPAVAAIVPETAARFVHDPTAGEGPWDRLEVAYVPEEMPKKPVGGISVRQQIDELEQLKALSLCAGGSDAAADREEPAAEQMISDHPVDKLAAWLLSQADLSDL
ncbi:MAG: hypothetical protein PVJ43_06020 [Gemmatimonadales bacterium]|jgi:hypothetical protein